MRIWTDGVLVQCAGISAGLGELRAIGKGGDLVDICYVERPTFFAYKNTHYSAFRHKNGTPISNALISTITTPNDIFRGISTAAPGVTGLQSATQEISTTEISAGSNALPIALSGFRWLDVQYIYAGQNATQNGAFSVTELGIENHTFWGVEMEICE